MAGRVQQVQHALAYLVVRSVICLLQALRVETCATAASVLSWVLADVLRIRHPVVDENLRHALPQLDAQGRRRLARQMWEHLILLVAEVALVPRKVHETNWRDHVRLERADLLVRQLLTDRPVLLLSGHFGNFEVAGYVLGILGFPTYSIARNLDNPYLHRFINRFRGTTGQHIIPKKGGYEQILRVLEAGGTLSILADQYAGAKGCWVEFFGRPASTHKALALFALEHDAPLLVGSAIRLHRPLRFEMAIHALADPRSLPEALCDPRRLTHWYSSELEQAIRRAPEQYWWLHRRWKDTRPTGKRGRAARAA